MIGLGFEHGRFTQVAERTSQIGAQMDGATFLTVVAPIVSSPSQ